MPWPRVIYNEEVMREGLGIAAHDIALSAKLELLDALSVTGLQRITLGAFVSPRYVPQMADFEALLQAMRPHPGVTYLPFIHNARARETARRYSPPLTLEDDVFALFLDICDIHQRRNVNRSLAQIIAGWPQALAQARAQGVPQGRIGIASAWGSNFMGGFSQDYRFHFLQQQFDLMQGAGIEVVEVGLHDSQSWCLPHLMEQDLVEVLRRWPQVQRFHLHMHNARGMALPALYAALRTLRPTDTVLLEGTLGGIGGGQFGGNGMASGMPATEDVLHMLHGMGLDMGVNMDRLIDAVWLLERIVGHAAFGHVSRAGPRPATSGALYDANLPAVESLHAARHFRLGPPAYADEGFSPWAKPIEGPYHPIW